MGLRYCTKTTSGYNISTENESARIDNILRQQIKVQILTLLSSKGQSQKEPYLLKKSSKNVNVRKVLQQQRQAQQQQQQL